MKGKLGLLVSVFIFALVFCTCNNFFHDIIPPDENRITRFEIDGQIGKARIGPNTVDVTVAKGTELSSVIPRISVSRKASLIPMTMDYICAAFPGIDFMKAVMRLYETSDIVGYVNDLIRETPGFNVPALELPVDLTGPIMFLVISGQGSIRQYTVNVEIDTGEPGILGFSFAKYDNPELITDSRGVINETERTVITTALYPMEMDYLSYALIPSFQIRGERLEIDGVEIVSGETEIQFEKVLGAQTKTITVWREGVSKNYALTVTFVEDPDSIRSIIDFRFYKTDNSRIAANAVASIINTEDTGTITVQVYYSGEKPQILKPSFITPGTASIGGIKQTSRSDSHDFSSPLEYRVVSRNGMYTRLYTVKVEFINLVSVAPRITSFRFNQNINHDLVQDTVGGISDGLIMIDAYYGGDYPPDTLIPEFTAQGIVTVFGSVQISGSSPQFFNRQVKYTVTNPENPVLTRDYWVQTRMTRDVSTDAKIISFGFYPEDNAGLADPVIGRVDQVTGKITLFASPGSGVTERIMYPRFEAVGQVSVGGIIQSSSTSPQTFNVPIIYTATSANGRNSRDYTVEVRELKGTIFVNRNALGRNDGTSWQDAFDSLKTACNAAAQFPEDIPKEIWIAAGTYTPGLAAEDYFPLTANTSYIGGFAGNETAKSQRNVAANKVTVSGDFGGGVHSNNLFGSFNGNSMLTVNGDLSFEDLTLEKAKAVMTGNRGNGAAICAVLPNGAELNISRCNFNGFTAVGNGGAVYVSGGSTEIADTTIEDVQAVDGGAVYSGGTLTVDNLTLRNVTGTGIYNSGGVLTVDNLTLRDITSYGIYKVNGGGVFLTGVDADGVSGDAVYCTGISGGQVRVGGNSIFNNTGRVYITSSVTVRVADTEIRNNTGDSALYVDSGSATATITGVTIDGVPNGRGIFANSTGSVQISESQIGNCTPTGDGEHGGGIYLNAGNCEISNVIVENCTFTGNGGGIYVSSANSVFINGSQIRNCTFNGSTYSNGSSYSYYYGMGGGIYLAAPGNTRNTVISGVTIENVQAAWDGAAIYDFSYSDTTGTFSITDSIITDAWGPGNVDSIDEYGYVPYVVSGAITTLSGGAVTFDGLVLRNITGKGISARYAGSVSLSGIDADGISGEAVECVSDASCSMRDSTFVNTGFVSLVGLQVQVTDTEIRNSPGNWLGYNALGAAGSGGTVTIERVTIDGVTNGGGIGVSATNSVLITDSTIRNCTFGPATRGTGIALGGGSGNNKISGVTIENCTDAYKSGGIYFSCGSGNNEISDVTIKNCTTTGGFMTAGGISFNSSSGNNKISGVTIENCTANDSGSGGIYFYGGSGNNEISSVTIKNAVTNYNGGGLYYGSASGKLVVTNSRFENCRATNEYGAIYTNSGGLEITNTEFINCTSRNDYKILDAGRFAFIRNSTFTHDSSLVNMGSPSGTNVVSVFGYGGGNFEGCTFNNLKGNMAGANYLFCRYSTYANTNTGSGGVYYYHSGYNYNYEWTLKNCTFNFNAGAAGLLALYAGTIPDAGNLPDHLLVDGCTINNNGGQQPLIWLNGNTPAGTFQFKRNNYYNGSLLDEALILSLGASGLVRITGNATPVIVP
jgi:hypothetical protein